MKNNFSKFIKRVNNSTKIFTPGPASLLLENLRGLRPCFGRGDLQYEKIEAKVLGNILKISGHKYVARLQGAASLALEVMICNFLFGNILIINTGFYSDRLKFISETSKLKYKFIKKIDYINYKELDDIKKKYDWIVACPVETSIGFKIPIKDLYVLKKKCNAKLALDATASIGLEANHELSDLAAFSSCKGLFGLTGAAFVCFNHKPENEINEFYLNLSNHINKMMTGPLHAICSLNEVLSNYKSFSYSVEINKKIFMKKMRKYLIYPNYNQPLLCTLVNIKLSKKNNATILYESRADIKGSVICHLGEVHLKRDSKGKILNNLKI